MRATQLESHLINGALIGAGLFIVYVLVRGAKGTTNDITTGLFGAAEGIVTGTIQGTADLLNGAYNAIPEPIKPTNPNNVIYGSVNAAGSVLTGDKDFTLGGWIYDVTH